jgi:hypothetical protein
MSKIGDIITVSVDPESNDGFDQAAALVTGVHDDGSLRVRVLGASAAADTMRNYVGDDGEPFDYAPATDEPAVDTESVPEQPMYTDQRSDTSQEDARPQSII